MSKVCKMRILICGILLTVAVCGISAVAACPSVQLKKYLDKDNCYKAVKVFNQSFAGTSEEEKYVEMILDYIKEAKSRWRAGELDYKEAVRNLTELAEIEHKEVSSEAKEMSKFIEVEGYGDECYKRAETCVEEKDYIGAMKILQKIDESYLMYADVKELKDFCKNLILKETEDLTTVNDLEAGIQKMDEYFEMVPEAAFAVRKGQLEKELSELKDIIAIVKEASRYYDAKDYKSAFVVLEKGMEKYPDHPKMQEGYLLYLERFVEMTVKEAQAACDQKDYDGAKEIVENALEVHDCEPLRQVLEHVKEEENVLYRWWNDIKDFFEKFKVVE